MEKLLAILRDIDPDIDYETEKHLIDDGLLDSMQVLELVSTLEDEFDIEIPDEDVEKLRTVGSVVSYVEDHT